MAPHRRPGLVDEEGFVYVLDRCKGMVIRSGESFYCIEVENCLFLHPSVLDCAVIAVPDRVLGELVAAVLHLSPSTPPGAVTVRDLQESAGQGREGQEGEALMVNAFKCALKASAIKE
ncbi:hypothetical protein DFJ73DRAFT_775624 [Zopfochytrium polystomum]|nr:hypothetical protein DFJ73DRAFT_775624 [Zopfochytrium polystomum]